MSQDRYLSVRTPAGTNLRILSRGAYESEKVQGADPPAWQTKDGRWRAQRTYSGPRKAKNEERDYELLLFKDGEWKHEGYFRVSDEALHHAAQRDGHNVPYKY